MTCLGATAGWRTLRGDTAARQDIYRAAADASARFAVETAEDSPSLMLFTDGSYANGVGGSGVAYSVGQQWKGRAVALGELEDGSNTAEMYAIRTALELARKVRSTDQRRIVIVTDSTRCLHWLAYGIEYPPRTAELVHESISEKERFANEGVSVKFRWVKGHNGVLGNEYADKLSKWASAQASHGFMKSYDISDLAAHFYHVGKKVEPKLDQVLSLPSQKVDPGLARERRKHKQKVRAERAAENRQYWRKSSAQHASDDIAALMQTLVPDPPQNETVLRSDHKAATMPQREETDEEDACYRPPPAEQERATLFDFEAIDEHDHRTRSPVLKSVCGTVAAQQLTQEAVDEDITQQASVTSQVQEIAPDPTPTTQIDSQPVMQALLRPEAAVPESNPSWLQNLQAWLWGP